MDELRAMCVAERFTSVQTYIASGNVVFVAAQPEAKVKAALEKRLAAFAGKRIGVVVRTVEEMAAVLAANPFPDAPTNSTVVIFLDRTPSPDALDHVRGRAGELVALGTREVYVAYGPGMAQSKLKIPAAADGTARNLNTVKKLAELAAAR